MLPPCHEYRKPVILRAKIEWAEFIYKYREEARMDVFKYSETFYNFVRCHSSLGNGKK